MKLCSRPAGRIFAQSSAPVLLLTLQVLVGLLLAGGGRPAAAQNLLTNPGFATALSGWTVGATFIQATWQPLDATGQNNSGSAVITSLPSGAGASNGINQCVPVTAGQAYDLGARVEIPSGQPSVFAQMNIDWLPGPNCGGGAPVGFFDSPLVQTGSAVFSGISATTTAPAGARSALFTLVVGHSPGDSTNKVVFFDDAYFQADTGCAIEATNLCLNDNRFKITATFDAGQGAGTAQAQAVTLTTDTGYLWFFDPTNVEAVVKVIDGCALNGHYWVFAGGLTNVKVVITATDTQNGAMKTYTNPQNTAFQPLQDTAAFGSCP